MYRTLTLSMLLAALFSGVSARSSNGITVQKREDSGTPSEPEAATSTTESAASTSTVPPNEITEAFNISIDGQIFPPPIHLQGVTPTVDFLIDCFDCSVQGNFSLSAGDSSIPGSIFETPDDVRQRANDSNFNFRDVWVAATFGFLNATFDISVNLTASNKTNELSVPLLPFIDGNPFTSKKSIGPLSLSATLTPEIHGWINTTTDVNFTHGFRFEVPSNSEFIVDLSNPDESKAYGFNETKLTPLPFTSTRGDPDVHFELSFRPHVTLKIELDALVAHGSVALDVGLDVPKLEANITQVRHADAKCEPASPSLPQEQVYDSLVLVNMSLGMDTFEKLTEEGSIPGLHGIARQDFEQEIFEIPLDKACLFYDEGNQTLITAPATKPRRQLLSQASRGRAPAVLAVVALAASGIMVTM